MRERLDLWWQEAKHHPLRTIWIIGAILAGIALIVVIILGYRLGWDWTGVNHPLKTLWDWLNLLGILAIPVAVALATAWFTTQQGKANEAENKDNQREAALQTYIDKMSELLLEKKLRESKKMMRQEK